MNALKKKLSPIRSRRRRVTPTETPPSPNPAPKSNTDSTPPAPAPVLHARPQRQAQPLGAHGQPRHRHRPGQGARCSCRRRRRYRFGRRSAPQHVHRVRERSLAGLQLGGVEHAPLRRAPGRGLAALLATEAASAKAKATVSAPRAITEKRTGRGSGRAGVRWSTIGHQV